MDPVLSSFSYYALVLYNSREPCMIDLHVIDLLVGLTRPAVPPPASLAEVL